MKNKKNALAGDNKTVYEFPYFGDRIGFFRIFAVKTILACLLSGFGMVFLAKENRIETDYPLLFLLSAGGCLFFSFLFSFFRKGHAWLFSVLSAAVFIFFRRGEIGLSAVAFWNHSMEFINKGGIFKTSGMYIYLPPDANVGADTFFMYAALLFGFIIAVTTYRRFTLSPGLVFLGFFCTPAFAAQEFQFVPQFAVVAAAIAAFLIMGFEYESSTTLIYGKAGYLDVQDRQFRKRTRKSMGVKRMKNDAAYYGKYTPNGITAFVCVLLVISITASLLPDTAFFDLSEIGKKISGFFDITANFFNGPDLNGEGYFTADTGGNISISGKINNTSATGGEDVVLQVTLERYEPVYLRGDVGYLYDNESWRSISGIDYANIYCGDITAEELMNSYTPDVAYLVLRQRLSASGYYASDYIGFQKVIIDYVKRTKTIFMPAYPYEMTFRDSDLYNTKGDFVSWVNRAGSISRFEVLTLYSTNNWSNYSPLGVIDGSYVYDFNEYICDGLSYYDYTRLNAYYEAFVQQLYLDVPQSERENILRFIEQFKGDGVFSDTSIISYNVYVEQKNYYIAKALCNYLSSGGGYKYSLTVDNTSGDNTYLGNFLFNTKEGHCSLYATAMTLALREMGIPARYVTGFCVNGHYDRETDEGYQYDIKEKQLHAWVEVYLGDMGWVTFDPTPADINNAANPAPEGEITTEATTETHITTEHEDTSAEETTIRTPASQESTSAASVTSTGGTSDGNTDSVSGGEILLKVLLIIAAAAVLAAIVLLMRYCLVRLDKNRRRLLDSFKKLPVPQAVEKMLIFTLRLLKMEKLKRENGELPMEYARRVDEKLKLSAGLSDIMPLFEEGEFQLREQISLDESQRMQVYGYVKTLLNRVMDVAPPKRLIRKVKLFRKVK